MSVGRRREEQNHPSRARERHVRGGPPQKYPPACKLDYFERVPHRLMRNICLCDIPKTARWLRGVWSQVADLYNA